MRSAAVFVLGIFSVTVAGAGLLPAAQPARDHGAVSGRLVGRRHRAHARRGHGEAARQRRAGGEPAGRRRRDRLQARRRPEARRLRAGVELQLDLHHLPLRPARLRLQGVRRRGARAGRVGRCSRCAATRSGRRWPTSIADAKARPGRITVGHSGIGSHTHISLAALFRPRRRAGQRRAVRRRAGGAEPARRPRRRDGAAARRAFRAGQAGPGARCSRRSSRAATPRCPTCRPRRSKASTCRSRRGAASRCRRARRRQRSRPSRARSARPSKARSSSRGRREAGRAPGVPRRRAVRRAYCT